ncbi:SRPBCC family protein [Nocardioides sp. CFH 31398]|uniref:SRPBCC family protein n=1 Tax=Nocardioides sp. CFH 31398 TaxID=2919579 RepID=UPI001F06EF8E|nr:SRPBCC family protein [Nocardioides sp. CFH 31398]MCH1865715.1 SRPBCC family protein [Nocardioides sp. CFH 31398]
MSATSNEAQTPGDTELEVSTEIAASPAQVWKLVSDLPRIAEWSPQVVRTLARRPLRVGSRMVNLNHRGPLVWPTTAKVVELDPHRRVAFRVTENWTVWSFTLEPVTVDAAEGTRVVHRRETPKGISPLSNVLVDKVLGGRPHFTEELREGMGQTLQRLKAAAEA